MTTIFEMIKRNAVPATVMRTASKGALPVPAEQMLEILVYLTQNPLFAQDARMTLASFDLASVQSIVASPQTAPEVLGYYWSQENRRPALMPVLIENPAVTDLLLMELAAEAPREIVTMLLASERVRKSYGVVEALSTNPQVTADELRELKGEPAPESTESVDAETVALHRSFEQQHAAEIAAEDGKAFELVQGDGDEPATTAEQPSERVEAAAATQEASQKLATAAAPNRSVADPAAEAKKLTLLQRLGRMTASERVKTAFIGGREERAVLIRDGARIVQNAVLSSPKLTDPEVELFSAAKNVHDNVLREIARTRRFMRNYSVVRNLVQNPKTPLDVALPLVKMLMVFDLKSLQRSRNVSETIRSLAAKYYREKALSGGRAKE
jgi:hypothetical protein